MDMVWILSVCVIPIIILTQIPTGGNANMCENDTYTDTNYLLSRVPNDPTNCTCLLKSTNQTTTKVFFNIVSLSGCRYKLAFYFKRNLTFMSCDYKSSTFMYYTITSETIKLNLEPYQNGRNKTVFSLNITSQPETDITMSCFNGKSSLSTSLSTTVLSSTTSTATITTSSKPTPTITTSSKPTTTITTSSEPTKTITTSSEPTATITTSSKPTATITTSSKPTATITTSSESTITNTTAKESSAQPSTGNISSTQLTTTNSSKSSTTEPNGRVSSTSTTNYTEWSTINMTTLLMTDPSEQKYISEIIGGAVGCLVLIACIIFIICVIKRKRRRAQKRKENGLSSKIIVDRDLEMTRKTPTISNRTFNNVNTENNDSTNPEMIIIPNDLYVSIDSLQQQTFHSFDKRNPEMEIIENDLYVSSDSVRKDNDNTRPEMEIIENDLYVGSDILRKDPSTDNNPKPEMEIIENDLYVSSDNLLKDHPSDTGNPHYYVVCPTCDVKGRDA